VTKPKTEEETAASNNMDLLGWLRKQLAEAEPDLLREMVRTFAESLMGAEADALCGASFRERSGERVNRRNGYRERPLDKGNALMDDWVTSESKRSAWYACPGSSSETASVRARGRPPYLTRCPTYAALCRRW